MTAELPGIGRTWPRCQPASLRASRMDNWPTDGRMHVSSFCCPCPPFPSRIRLCRHLLLLVHSLCCYLPSMICAVGQLTRRGCLPWGAAEAISGLQLRLRLGLRLGHAAPPLSLPLACCPLSPALAICGSFYACVSTCPNWPNVATHTRTHTLPYSRTHCLSVKCAVRLCVPVCVLVSVAAGQSPSCVMHPSNGEQAQWSRPCDYAN